MSAGARATLAIGVGFRKACTAETLVALVREALARACAADPCVGDRKEQWSPAPAAPDATHPRERGDEPEFGVILATIAEKDRPPLRQAAATLGLDVLVLPKAALAGTADRITVVSEAAKACLGLPSVAEAAALAAAGPGARILVPRIASADATCAIAIGGGAR